jgi:hypothetical protein
MSSARVGSVSWIKSRSTACLVACFDVPLGALLYVVGGWPLIAIQCVVFFLMAIALIVWGVSKEVRGVD